MTRWTHNPKPDPNTGDSDRMDERYAMVFGSEQGLKVLDDLLKQVEFPSINDREINANTCIWKEARRALLLYVQNRVKRGTPK
ncbi:hypothetical protein [Pacificispira sp.]|uniref:hypothetical protein n=1 Tax=Pacificispira sp. TaxID=2888761 RepID=UPI003BAABDB0